VGCCLTPARLSFQTYDTALRQLQPARGNGLVMWQLRTTLPPWLMPSCMDDQQILHFIATQVAQGTAALKTQSSGTGDLPWPEILTDLGRFEGSVPHMYVDTKGYVTVGIGKMLPSAAEAQKLPFTVRATGAAATQDEIAADFAKVHAQPMGQNWRKYKSDLDLPQATIDKLAKEIAERCVGEVAARYKGYDDYPVQVKQVLIDMRYNMGGNMDKFKSFKRNIELAQKTGTAKYWEAAAKESHRKDVQDDRNDWASDMILKGGGVKKK